MERPPYIFQDITHFSVANVEKHDPRLKEITKLTLEVGSKTPPGTYPLVLVKPFPPFGRPGAKLKTLASLCADDIESIWVFPKSDGRPRERIEIWGNPSGISIIVRCEAIEGVPGWDEMQS